MPIRWLIGGLKGAGPLLRKGPFAAPQEVRPLTEEEQAATDRFHCFYYDAWKKGRHTVDLSWFGYRTWKCPLDLWIYQEILVATEPELIVECGTNEGGSALYLASICDLARRGRVLTIDTTQLPNRPEHKRIEYVHGSSTEPNVVAYVRRKARGKRTMVILDSDHSQAHVRAELDAYKDVVTVGCYLIVEDTNVNGHPVFPTHGPGPMEALEDFLRTTAGYQVDADCERLMMTFNPRGYLKRVA